MDFLLGGLYIVIFFSFLFCSKRKMDGFEFAIVIFVLENL
jgi:hypothetical protein